MVALTLNLSLNSMGQIRVTMKVQIRVNPHMNHYMILIKSRLIKVLCFEFFLITVVFKVDWLMSFNYF